MPAAGGAFEATVTTGSGCAWTAESLSPWLSVVSGNYGSGTGRIGISVAPNAGVDSRTGAVVAAERTVTVTQAAGAGSLSAVRIEGEISEVSGTCPDLTFVIDGAVDDVRTLAKTTVITGSGTSFTGVSCGDLRDRDKVRVTGAIGSDGRLTASTVEFLER